MNSLIGRSALVTGAGAGIGEACAWELARAGAAIGVADLDVEAAHRVAEEIVAALPVQAWATYVDVRSPESVQDMVDMSVREYGQLDIAVNNAGVPASRGPLADLTPEQWHKTISVNLDGVFLCTSAEIRAMRRSGGGSIVNMGSILSVVGFRESAAYVASKHGVLGLTRAAALDHAADGIRVNAVGPGFVRTAQFDHGNSEDEKSMAAGLHPRGAVASPQEIASLVAFLSGPGAANITGGFFPCDGGYTVQ